MPLSPLNINLDNEDYLIDSTILNKDLARLTKFYTELEKVKIETYNVCYRL